MSRMPRSFSTGCAVVAMGPFAVFGGYSISSKILNIGSTSPLPWSQSNKPRERRFTARLGVGEPEVELHPA
jgi:hypothetical protein